MTNREQIPMLTPGAEVLVSVVLKGAPSAVPGRHHWLLALLERNGGIAERMVPGLNVEELRRLLVARLATGDFGEPLDKDRVIESAVARAKAEGRERAAERDLAFVILQVVGYQPIAAILESPAETVSVSPASARHLYTPRVRKPMPELDRFGRDLTREAAAGRLPSVVGRDREIDAIIETLCRTTKRNPVLIGDAGVGKTAIVEGLARRVVEGNVPALLRGIRIVAVQISSLVAGASYTGELEKRMKALLEEASQDGIVLFIDEIHSIIGSGGQKGTTDIASLLKPSLARGEIACIAATTGEEYRGYIVSDTALERRFQPIVIEEFSTAQTLEVLGVTRDRLERLRGVRIQDELLSWLVDFAERFLPHRHFPDKAIDLLEQSVAHAVSRDMKILDRAVAESVAQRMVGMPVDSGKRLNALREHLETRALLPPEDIRRLVDRLSVTSEGMDMRAKRPNAVVLLAGDARARAVDLSAAIAEVLFGSADRVVTIDFGRFLSASDITLLLGAPPGYIGYSEPIALHRVAKTPWCVLRCENLHACHPQFIAILSQALQDGYITDARGQKISLSDTVVLLSAESREEMGRNPMGFTHAPVDDSKNVRSTLASLLGDSLLSQTDLICTGVPEADSSCGNWIEKEALPRITARFDKKGVRLGWDESVVRWFAAKQAGTGHRRDWERIVDEQLTPRLLASMKEFPGNEAGQVVVTMKGDDLVLQSIPLKKEV